MAVTPTVMDDAQPPRRPERSAASRRIGQIVFYVGVIGFVIALFMIPTDGHGSRIRSSRDMWFFGLGMASAVVIWIGLLIHRKSRPLKSP